MLWHDTGRIRFGLLFEEMKSSKPYFEKALCFCKNNEIKTRKKYSVNEIKR